MSIYIVNIFVDYLQLYLYYSVMPKNIINTESLKRILHAIKFFGSESALARAVGKKPGHVYLWKHTKVPAEIAKQIEEESRGHVPRYVTRPDIFDRPKQRQRAA